MTEFRQPIGVFDSGVGGLTVAREIQKQLPDERIIYFGDSARCPYGDRSPADVLAFSIEIAEFLVREGIRCLVIACNTATAIALSHLNELLTIPLIGVIKPGAAAAVAATQSGRIGVIGTSVTMESHAYRAAIQGMAKDIVVIEQACPEFVPLVERGIFDGPVVEAIVRKSLAVFEGQDVDTLVLGCTHYPMLAPMIRRVVGPGINVISSAGATAGEVKRVLRAEAWPGRAQQNPVHRFFTTGDGSSMRMALANWFHTPVPADAVGQVVLPSMESPLVDCSRASL